MKKIILIFISISLMCSMSLLTFADFGDTEYEHEKIEPLNLDEPEEIFEGNKIQEISNVDSKPLKVKDIDSNNCIVNDENMFVEMPEELSDGIELIDEDCEIELKISITNVDFSESDIIDNTVVYENEDGDSLLGIDILDCGIQQTFVLENLNADKRYTINYDNENISYMNFAFDDNGKTDGSVLIYDINGDIIAAIGKPWAKDNNGNDVETYYEINGTELTQVIEPNSDNEYPIVADPLTYTSYIKSSKWIYRSDSDYPRALSIVPKIKACGLAGGYAAWPYIVEKHSSSKYWKNTKGLKNQFVCHAMTVQNFKTWNIEPGRPSVSFAKTCACACNPD